MAAALGSPAVMRRPSDGGEAAAAAARLSRQYFEHNRLDVGQSLQDGFRDAGPGSDPEIAGCTAVLDRKRDPALERFVERCRKKLRKAKDEAAQAMVLALLVSDTCGRSGSHASDLVRRHLRLASENRDGQTGELLIGDLLGDKLNPSAARTGGKTSASGAALAPHRALLFKALTDWLGLPGCTIERRRPTPEEAASGAVPSATACAAAASWNVVSLGTALCIVDLIFDPGALYEQPSAKAREYLRLLDEAEAEVVVAASGGAPAQQQQQQRRLPDPPSSREELAGLMHRPPWHVEPWALDIQRAERIGRGGFGEVFHGRWAGVHVAIKEIKDATPTDAEVVDFMLEIALLSQLNHPNIVRFWRGSTQLRGGSRSLLMVTEYVKQGGLSRLLHGHGGPALPEQLTLPQALSFGLDIARGVQYLHSQRILHLDLKSPNVLVAPLWTAKLCDFGLAKIRGEQTMVHSTLQGVSPVWAPPEMFDSNAGGLSEKADVYSFAVIFFELLTKRVPFQEVSAQQLPHLKAQGQLPQIPEKVPEDCAQLIRQCCAATPGSRPSMSGVVARVREVAQGHSVVLTEVRPPAGLTRDDGQEGRLQEAEQAAAQRLVELDGVRARLRTETNEIQRRLEQVRRRALELSAAASASGGGGGGGGGASASTGPAAGGGPGSGTSPGGRSSAPECDDAWCDAFVQEVAGAKFRCGLCSKLFRGPEFVRRHVASKHRAEVRRAAEDAYFDCDVSREDSLPAHRSMASLNLARAAPAAAVVSSGAFSQALQDAAERGDAAQVESLLALRASPSQRDDNGAGPLAIAARSGHLAVAEALLRAAAESEEGQQVAVKLASLTTGAGLTPLHMAAAEGHAGVLAALLQRGADHGAPCAQGKTPLLHAGENGHTAACSLLLNARASVEAARAPDGETLLHVAARFGAPELIAQVVAWRADLTTHDRDGWTPLHEAAHWGASAVEALLRAAADTQARSRDGETPLHVALEGYEQAAVCEVLLHWRADPSIADVDGEVPLHVAARKGSVEACRILLLGGAEANALDAAGRRPLDLARGEEVAAALAEFGALRGEAVSDEAAPRE